MNIKRPVSNSMETWIDKTWHYAFVDFTAFNAANTGAKNLFYMAGATNGNRYHDSQQAEWTKIYDGVFYIREMYPCKKTD